jgi:hypothetical protein
MFSPYLLVVGRIDQDLIPLAKDSGRGTMAAVHTTD